MQVNQTHNPHPHQHNTYRQGAGWSAAQDAAVRLPALCCPQHQDRSLQPHASHRSRNAQVTVSSNIALAYSLLIIMQTSPAPLLNEPAPLHQPAPPSQHHHPYPQPASHAHTHHTSHITHLLHNTTVACHTASHRVCTSRTRRNHYTSLSNSTNIASTLDRTD